jgi:hypothetical protein
MDRKSRPIMNATIAVLAALAPVAFCTLACSSRPAGVGPGHDAATDDAAAPAALDAASEAPSAGGASDDASDAGSNLQPVQATRLLDDMRGGPPRYLTDGPGTGGIWFTYSDRMAPWSFPPIYGAAPGLLVPPEESPFGPTDDDAGPLYQGQVQPYRRCYGGGESSWGAGLGTSFVYVAPDRDVPMNDCDAGLVVDVSAEGPDPAVGVPFDATGWTGLQFWAKSLRDDNQQVYVRVSDDRTSPFGLPADAGGCNVCLNVVAGGGTGSCGDEFARAVTFTPEWTQFQIPFASMHPQGYSGVSTSAVPNVGTLFELTFQIQLTAGSLPPFDVAVSYIELYK